MSGKRRQRAMDKWKVLISTTLIQSVVCGVIESYGALFIPMMKSVFPNEPQKTVKAALIGSLASGILMGFSPISSWLSGLLGAQIVAVMGGVVIFIATFSASFSKTFAMMAFTYGICLGIGCSLLFISNSIIISQHFGEDSILAFGLLGFGNGVINSIMPHIMTFAVDSIGLNGAIRTICLLLSPIMFLPFYWKEIDADAEKSNKLSSDNEFLPKKTKYSINSRKISMRSNRNQGNKISKRTNKKQRKQDYNYNNKHMWESDYCDEDMIVLRHVENTNNPIHLIQPKRRRSRSLNFDFLSPRQSSEKIMPDFNLVEYFDVFKNKGYLNLCLSMVVASLGYQVPNVHICNYSNDLSLPGNAQLLLTCLGGASAIGPLINPFVVDKFEEQISKFRIFQIFVLGYGISVMFLPLVNNFSILMFTCTIIGYFDGSFATLVGPLIIDLVGTENAGNAMGIYYGSISLSVTIAAPLAGFIFEVGQSYRMSFFVAGLFFLAGGFMLSFTHKNFKFQEQSSLKSQENREGVS